MPGTFLAFSYLFGKEYCDPRVFGSMLRAIVTHGRPEWLMLTEAFQMDSPQEG